MERRRLLMSGAAAALARPAVVRAQNTRLLTFIPQSDLPTLDPMVTTAYTTRNHAHLVWDTLYGYDSSMQPRPQLAEGHLVEDGGLRWTFTLRQGPTFHDGTPVRAADAVASIKRWWARDTLGQTLAARVDAITALDDRRFEIRLKAPFGPMLAALGKPSSYACFIMPERLAATDPTKPIPEVIGSGPLRFVADEWRQGDRVVYAKYEKYVPAPGEASMTAGPKVMHFDRLEWRIIKDPATAAAAIQTGEIDWYEQVAPDVLPLLKRARGVKTARIDASGNLAMLRMNHLHPPFDKPEARQALLRAISQTDHMAASMGEDQANWNDQVGVFPPGTPLASDEGLGVLTGPRDLDAARAMLRDAGVLGAKVVVLHPPEFPINNALTLVTIDTLKKIGLEPESATSDWGGVLQRRARKEPPGQGGWNMVVALFGAIDLSNPGAHPLLRGNGDGAWFGWPTAPALEALRDRWFEAPELGAQQAIAREIQRQFWVDVPYVPLGQYFQNTAFRDNLTGHLSGMVVPWNVRRV